MSCIKNHESLKIIDHTFLVAGHTHMECDMGYALIEKKKKLIKRQFPILMTGYNLLNKLAKKIHLK